MHIGQGVSQMLQQHLTGEKFPQILKFSQSFPTKAQLDVALLKKCSTEIPQEKQMKTGTFQNTQSAKQALNKSISGEECQHMQC